MTDFMHRSDFKPLISVTNPISVGTKFPLEIGLLADLKILKTLELPT
jgi:hypothetical protein